MDRSSSDSIGARRSAPPASPARRVLKVGVAGALVLGLLASGAPLCPVAYLTGFPCPGCGLTRAAFCLGHGDVAGAVASSPLSPIVVPLFFFLVVRSVVLYLGGRDAKPPSWLTRGAVVLWIALIIVWALRFVGWFGGPVSVRSLWT